MMKNPNAGKSLDYLSRFAKAGIALNTQLVLCPGINDGEELEFSLNELFKLYPSVQSIAAVPVGLSDHREGLYPLEAYTRETAGAVIDTIDRLNSEFYSEHGTIIAYAADEFYLKAGRDMPDEEYYNGYPQLENGVGMWALLKSEFTQALENLDVKCKERKVSVVTGKAAYPLIKELAELAMKRISGLCVNVIEAENRLFGKNITVSGLLCGADIYEAVKDSDLGEELLIPPNTLKNNSEIFLDDMTVTELSQKLNVNVSANGVGGDDLLFAMLGSKEV